MKKLTFVVLTAVFTFSVNAQNKKKKTRKP